MLNALVNIDWSKVVTPLITAAVTGLGTWAIMAGRKAAKNLGKTEVEMDEADLIEAEKAVEAAKLTKDDPKDDERAAAWEAKAKAKLANAKRWQAVLDAVGDTASSSE